jgi:hypothetical protein
MLGIFKGKKTSHLNFNLYRTILTTLLHENPHASLLNIARAEEWGRSFEDRMEITVQVH